MGGHHTNLLVDVAVQQPMVQQAVAPVEQRVLGHHAAHDLQRGHGQARRGAVLAHAAPVQHRPHNQHHERDRAKVANCNIEDCCSRQARLLRRVRTVVVSVN